MGEAFKCVSVAGVEMQLCRNTDSTSVGNVLEKSLGNLGSRNIAERCVGWLL